MAKERKRLINEDMVSEIPPHHPVPSITASVHHRRLGGRFHVRGRTGNDNSGILTTEDNNETQTDNIRGEKDGMEKESGFAQQSTPSFDPRVSGNSNSKVLDESVLQNQIQHNLDQEKFEGEDMFNNASTNVSNVHDQYSYQSHENNSHTNSYTGTLNSAHSQQHSPHASACSASIGGTTGSGSNNTTAAGYVTPTPQQQPQSDYESSYHSSSMTSSQHSGGQAQNPFPHGNQIIVQDPIKPDLLN